MKIGRMDINKRGILFESPRSVLNLHWKHLLAPKHLIAAVRILLERKPAIEIRL